MVTSTARGISGSSGRLLEVTAVFGTRDASASGAHPASRPVGTGSIPRVKAQPRRNSFLDVNVFVDGMTDPGCLLPVLLDADYSLSVS